MDYKPMLLEKAEPFSDSNFIFEPKFNGIRIVVTRFNGKVQLYTRHGLNMTNRYPDLCEIPVDGDVVLDGELIALKNGVDDFELCMKRFSSSKHINSSIINSIPAIVVVFDILHSDKYGDTRSLPLMTRKKILSTTLRNDYDSHYVLINFIDGEGETLFKAIQEKQMEGVVAKRKNSTYDLLGRRTSSWVKIIDWKYTDVYVSGWSKDKFGWYVSIKDKGKIIPVGTVELGVPSEHRKAFYTIAQQLILKETKKSVYIEPVIRINVKFRNWTSNGKLFTPVFCDFSHQSA